MVDSILAETKLSLQDRRMKEHAAAGLLRVPDRPSETWAYRAPISIHRQTRRAERSGTAIQSRMIQGRLLEID